MKTLVALLVLAASTVSAQEPLQTYPMAPCRLVDSRQHVGWTLDDGETGYVFLRGPSGVCGIPWDAKAIMATVAAVNPSKSGYLTVHSYTGPRPAIASINFNAGLTASSLVFTAVSPALSDVGQGVKVYARVPGGHVDWVIDVVAYLR